MDLDERLRTWCNRLKQNLLEFNLFSTFSPNIEQHEIDSERISTRIYIFLLVVLVVILASYTAEVEVLVPNIISNIPALNSTVQSRYQINSTLDEIINQLMVEQWSNSTSHEAYYDQCNPALCIYSYVGKNGLITIITTIIELIG
ncbi:unnamed protein product, partial [Rotaria sp. Silwood1]